MVGQAVAVEGGGLHLAFHEGAKELLEGALLGGEVEADWHRDGVWGSERTSCEFE
jgi:hypothetical protein